MIVESSFQAPVEIGHPKLPLLLAEASIECTFIGIWREAELEAFRVKGQALVVKALLDEMFDGMAFFNLDQSTEYGNVVGQYCIGIWSLFGMEQRVEYLLQPPVFLKVVGDGANRDERITLSLGFLDGIQLVLAQPLQELVDGTQVVTLLAGVLELGTIGMGQFPTVGLEWSGAGCHHGDQQSLRLGCRMAGCSGLPLQQ